MTADEPIAPPDDAPGDAPPMSSTYRCFLFADLRGYTAFMDRAGNAAGAELLDDYLDITRAAVARHHGAEIKVEGDGFHAVFQSASSAVMCALAIMEAVADANSTRPQRPIRVGIGIHAGEALETADGFIGSAVNIAARVCAAAAAGEILVTGTVRGITQASIPVDFVSRGRRRLKGIGEPVEVFAVSQGTVPGERRNVAEMALVLGAVALIALAAIAVVLGGQLGSNPGPSASPIAVASAQPVTVGQLAIGRYEAPQFRPPFNFVIMDLDWAVYRDRPDALGLVHEEAPNGRLDVARVEDLYNDPCVVGGETFDAGTTATDLLAALQSVPFLDVGVPTEVVVDGRSGLTVDIDVDPGALAACGSFGGGGVAILSLGDESWDAQPGERVRVISVDVDGRAVSFLMSMEASPAGSVTELEEFFRFAQRVVDSVNF